MSGFSVAETFDFPCDHVFKAFGPNDAEFTDAVRDAITGVVSVSPDAIRTKPSAKGSHQAVSVLVRVRDYRQMQEIYLALKKVLRLKYLL